MDFLRLSPFISDCPNCGNEFIGNGQGALNVDENMVRRTCKCGFVFEYDVNNGTSKERIKKAIDETLRNM